MSPPTLLPHPELIRLDYVVAGYDAITLVATTVPKEARCPTCGRAATRVHSHYERTVSDLPWRGVAVRLQLHSRRFFCDQADCRQRIFTERLPDLISPSSRRTDRLAEELDKVAYALGGEPGARMASDLGMPVSGDTLLRQLQASAAAASEPVRVLGVDDWARRKGHRYGTILVDLERGAPVDLLPDRKAETLAQWLKEHPGVEIISRDRAGTYAEGARQGAPDAVQVADRWHLLQNLAEALEGILIRKHRAVREAAQAAVAPAAPPASDLPAVPTPPEKPRDAEAAPSPTWASRAAREKAGRRDRRYERYREVVARHQQGESRRQIAAAVGLSRETVRRYLEAGTFPEIARRSNAAPIVGYLPYLQQRWQEGCHNARVLWEEIVAQGFPGSKLSVYRATALWREVLPAGERRSPRGDPRTAEPTPAPVPSSRTVVWWLIGSKEEPTAEQAVLVERLCAQCPEIHQARELVQTFYRIVKERQADKLGEWVAAAVASGIEEIAHFGAGLRRDWDAVVAGLTLPWSNGPVEGQINRLKMLKRQMFGRAGLALLRARVLPLPKAA